MPDIVNNREGFTLYGYRTNLVGGLSIGTTNNLEPNFLTFLDGIGITSTFRAVGSSSIFARFSQSPETLTGQPTTTETDGNSRFSINFNDGLSINRSFVFSSHTGETRFTTSATSISLTTPSPAYDYAVGDNLGLATFSIRQNGINSFVNPPVYIFSYFGYCRNPAYGGIIYPLDYISLIQSFPGSGSPVTRIWRAASTNQNNTAVECSIEPSITCDIANPSANTSDVIFRDVPSPNYAIGRARPFLLWTNQALTINTIHRVINKGNNPYLVVATAGTGRLLMPVWTENLV